MGDTICALATPFGKSALAIVRVSGKNAFNILDLIFKPKNTQQKYFVATRGDVLDIDDAISIKFPEGRSFTGESSFELILHGSPIIIERILNVLYKLGVRLANPGEFTLRAFLSGRISINEAEAISDLITASSEEAAKVAFRNLKGILFDHINPIRDRLVSIISEFDACLEFPDENIGHEKYSELRNFIKISVDKLESLLKNVTLGKILINGARIVLIGYPNAGKSTLFNRLIGKNKALIHETAGTTRDVLEETCVLEGIPVTFVDTAGFHVHDDEKINPVEKMGIDKAKKELYLADLIISLSEPNSDYVSIPPDIDTPILRIKTKLDLTQKRSFECDLEISANTGLGLDSLKQKIIEIFVKNQNYSDEPLLTKARQIEETRKAYESLLRTESLLNNGLFTNDEFIVFELREAAHALDRLLGKDVDIDVLNSIFSKFCIGK